MFNWLGRPAGLQPLLDRTEEPWFTDIEYSAFSLLTPPFPTVCISSLPLSPFFPLYSQICPTPFFSVPLALWAFFHSTHPPLPPITHVVYAPPTPPASTGANVHSLLTTENTQSHQPHTHDPLRLHTHFLCVCLPPLHSALLHFPLWPLLPLFSSVPLFLNSLCRWRSRWLARVRELSALIFYSLCHFPPLFCLSPPLCSVSPIHLRCGPQGK